MPGPRSIDKYVEDLGDGDSQWDGWDEEEGAGKRYSWDDDLEPPPGWGDDEEEEEED